MNQNPIELNKFYHIYNRGNNKENIFKEIRNYDFFLSLIEKYIIPIANMYSFCLLKNHFHFLIKTKDASEIPSKLAKKPYLAFSNMFNAYTKSINKAYNRTGSLFQEHFHRIEIKDEDYLRNLMIYIHLNPVKHKFTNNFQGYPYSSFKRYLSNKNEFFLKKDYIIELFGDFDNFIFCHEEGKIRLDGIMNDINILDGIT
jgi:putative transposase